jgi:hypothetical protein
MIISMPRKRAYSSIPDLFSATKTRDAFPAQASQGPSPKAAVDSSADGSVRRYSLPKDLPRALKQLGDSELISLLGAAFEEAKRRDKLGPDLVAISQGRKPSLKSNQHSKAREKPSVAVSLTRGQVNAVRAAFKAGIGPSRIAREFGISQADVRKVLASDAREREKRS